MKDINQKIDQQFLKQYEKQIILICQEIIVHPYISKNALEKSVGLDIEPILEEIQYRLEKIGVEVHIITLNEETYYVPFIPASEGDIPPETVAVLGIFGTMQNLFRRPLKEQEMNHYFDQVNGRILDLEKKNYIQKSTGKNWEITPLGYAVLKDMPKSIPKIVKEMTNTTL